MYALALCRPVMTGVLEHHQPSLGFASQDKDAGESIGLCKMVCQLENPFRFQLLGIIH